MQAKHSEISRPGFSLGRQMTIEYYDCDPEILADAVAMEEIFVAAALASGATVLGSNFHAFVPQGVSGVVLIAESHFTVHAWPEHDYAAVDIFTCGETINFQVGVDTLKQKLCSTHMIVSSVMNRGIVNNNGIERLVPIFEDHSNRYALSWKTRYESTHAAALTASIDLYNVSPHVIRGSEEPLWEFAAQFIARSGIFPPEAQVALCEADSDTRVLRINHGVSSLTGRFNLRNESVFLDLFDEQYFEPREAAELAIELLSGTHYRMQVAIRQ